MFPQKLQVSRTWTHLRSSPQALALRAVTSLRRQVHLHFLCFFPAGNGDSVSNAWKMLVAALRLKRFKRIKKKKFLPITRLCSLADVSVPSTDRGTKFWKSLFLLSHVGWWEEKNPYAPEAHVWRVILQKECWQKCFKVTSSGCRRPPITISRDRDSSRIFLFEICSTLKWFLFTDLKIPRDKYIDKKVQKWVTMEI